MVIPIDGLFYPILTRIMDSFPCSPLHTSFLDRRAASVRPTCVRLFIYLSHGLVRVYEICYIEASNILELSLLSVADLELFVKIECGPGSNHTDKRFS